MWSSSEGGRRQKGWRETFKAREGFEVGNFSAALHQELLFDYKPEIAEKLAGEFDLEFTDLWFRISVEENFHFIFIENSIREFWYDMNDDFFFSARC